jgi:hypothetical protein
MGADFGASELHGDHLMRFSILERDNKLLWGPIRVRIWFVYLTCTVMMYCYDVESTNRFLIGDENLGH